MQSRAAFGYYLAWPKPLNTQRMSSIHRTVARKQEEVKRISSDAAMPPWRSATTTLVQRFLGTMPGEGRAHLRKCGARGGKDASRAKAEVLHSGRRC